MQQRQPLRFALLHASPAADFRLAVRSSILRRRRSQTAKDGDTTRAGCCCIQKARLRCGHLLRAPSLTTCSVRNPVRLAFSAKCWGGHGLPCRPTGKAGERGVCELIVVCMRWCSSKPHALCRGAVLARSVTSCWQLGARSFASCCPPLTRHVPTYTVLSFDKCICVDMCQPHVRSHVAGRRERLGNCDRSFPKPPPAS